MIIKYKGTEFCGISKQYSINGKATGEWPATIIMVIFCDKLVCNLTGSYYMIIICVNDLITMQQSKEYLPDNPHTSMFLCDIPYGKQKHVFKC